ncbi:TPA: hypothetical protein ACIBE3_001793 [Salmonella enterica subsp. enterica serovar Reading]
MFNPDYITEKGEAFFHYINMSGEISSQLVAHVVQKGEFFQGYSVNKRGYRTFKKNRVLKMFRSEFELDNSELPEQLPIGIEITSTPSVNLHTDRIEICFTGFNKADKSRLELIAKTNHLHVTNGITEKLFFLCVGKNKGWRKLEKAREKNTLIITEDQFIHFVDTGEIPVDASSDLNDKYEKAMNPEETTLNEVTNELSLTFRTIREARRSSALIANFKNGYAVGWSFAVKDVFKDSLDIKLTNVTYDGKEYQVWTQGTSYQFHRGDVFYSDKIGYESPNDFLRLSTAVVLQVKYEVFSGYETTSHFDGFISGSFFQNGRISVPTELNNVPILMESQSYDSGTIIIDVFIPNKERNKLILIDELTMSQDDFICLLQTGVCYGKRSGKPREKVDVFNYDCS